jgi:pyruvate formate lyase activating enzyme
MLSALVTNIQGYSIHDGPGIRTTVFLKGCVLSCRWCANPESISCKPELGFLKSLCTRCAACVTACPRQAVTHGAAGFPHVDRARCVGCGECVSACTHKARVIYGEMMSVGEVVRLVSADKLFYDSSGGGVTVTGGEPLMQHEFVRAVFNELHGDGIHTCIETCGCVDRTALLEVLPVTDYVLFDLKVMNTASHRKHTGKSNEPILANARLVADSQVEFLFRMPVIPGVNDSAENVAETASFLKALGKRAERIELMPYHRLGESKYAAIGRRYPLHGLSPMDSQDVEPVKQAFEMNGILCTVST